MVWYGMVWYGIVWYGMVWYGMVWYGMVWHGEGAGSRRAAATSPLCSSDSRPPASELQKLLFFLNIVRIVLELLFLKMQSHSHITWQEMRIVKNFKCFFKKFTICSHIFQNI